MAKDDSTQDIIVHNVNGLDRGGQAVAQEPNSAPHLIL